MNFLSILKENRSPLAQILKQKYRLPFYDSEILVPSQHMLKAFSFREKSGTSEVACG